MTITLAGPRVDLIPLSAAMIDARLAYDDFVLDCATSDGARPVHFDPQWAGDLLALFPMLRATIADGQVVPDTFVVVDRTAAESVGQLGAKGGVDVRGEIEIGYGISLTVRGRGYATEAVSVLAAHLAARPEVRAITAETAVGNAASRRVLERNGFVRTGTSWSEDDGDLLLWRRG